MELLPALPTPYVYRKHFKTQKLERRSEARTLNGGGSLRGQRPPLLSGLLGALLGLGGSNPVPLLFILARLN